MGLKSILRKLGWRDRLSRLARGTDRVRFVRSLGEAPVFIIVGMDAQGFDPQEATAEEIVSVAERGTKALHEAESFTPWVWGDDNGRQYLPLFSTSRHLEEYAAARCRKHGRSFPIQAVSVAGAILLPTLRTVDGAILNPDSTDEYSLGKADIELCCEMWESQDR